MTKPHDSDCAIHNEPAMPAGPCDCGVTLPPEALPIAEGPADVIVVNPETGERTVVTPPSNTAH